MKYAALLFAAVLATTSLGCHSLGHDGLLGCGCASCTGVSAGCSDCNACTAEAECSDCLAADAQGVLHHHANGGGLLGHGLVGGQPAMYAEPGPPVGTVTYPYYTFHGPRDFLNGNSTSIGR